MRATDLNLVPGLSPDATFEELRKTVDTEGCCKRKIAFHLDEIHERSLHSASAYSSTAHFAREQLDMSPRRTRESIQVGRALRNLTLLDLAYKTERVSWSKVVRMLKVIQVETQTAWIDFAETHTWNELRLEVRRCRPGELPGHGTDYNSHPETTKYSINFPVAYQHLIDNTRAFYREQNGGKEMSLSEFFTEMLVRAATVAAQESDLHWVPMLPFDERNHDSLAPGVRDAVLRRDNHQCLCCHRLRDLQVHHIQFRSSGGSNDTNNLATLCRVCHASIHAGYLIAKGDPESDSFTLSDRHGNPLARGVRPVTNSV